MNKTETKEAVKLEMPEINQTIIEPSAAEKMLAVIEKAADNPKYNTDKMRALLDMNMELLREDRKLKYIRAMKLAQEEMKPIVRMAENKFTKSKYAKLEHIDFFVRPIYTKHGFCLSFDSHKEADGSHTVIVEVMHEDGHTTNKQINANIDDVGPEGKRNKTNPQGVSSTVSILKRQLTAMVFNIVLKDEDDDGQGGKIAPDPAKFTDRVSSSAAAKAPEPVKLTLAEAAEVLEKNILAADDKARGRILMNNIKIIGEMEKDVVLSAKAAKLRKLCEAPKNV